MKIQKDGFQVLSVRKTVSNRFTITNDKNETMEIDIVSFYQDDDLMGIDSEETLYDENEQEITWDDIQNFLGEESDVDELKDEINDLIEL